MKTSVGLLVVLVALPCLCCFAQAAEGSRQLNGSFEIGTDAPVGWSCLGDGTDGFKNSWLKGEARTGVRALAGESRRSRAAWVSETLPLNADKRYVVAGWIKPFSAAAWMQVQIFDSKGKAVGRWRSPRVAGCSGWTYVAVEIPRLQPGRSGRLPVAAQIAFWVKGGRAVLDDVSMHPIPLQAITNGDFELPVDRKGRIPYWSEETSDSLLAGAPAGNFSQDNDSPIEGSGCVAVTTTGEWFGVSSIHYPVWPWSNCFEVTAMTRCEPDARAQLVVVWADAAQQVLSAEAGPTVEETDWRPMTTGVLRPPTGTHGLRVILAVRKKAEGTASQARAWFDTVVLRSQEKPFLRVVANQVGYEAGGPKSAVLLTNFFPKKTALGDFELVNEDGQCVWHAELACSGRMYGQDNADWGWYFWRADFSPFSEDGRYRARAILGKSEASSYPFRIGRDVLFTETAPINVDFFFVQRCGFDVPGWHRACHLDDARLEDGTHRDLTGGWHSAGDYNKLTWEYGDGGVLYALVNAAEAAPEFFAQDDRDNDNLPDILDEAWWGAKFLAKVQVPETGGLLNHIEQGPDRTTWMKWCPPEETTDNIVGTADDPVVTEGEGRSPLAIGGWARLAEVLEARGVRNDYLARAVRLWEHATADGSAGPDPLLLISTVDLYLVTREARFLAFCRRSAEGLLALGDPAGQLAGGYGDSGDIPAAALAHFALELPDEPLAAEIGARLKNHLPHFVAEADNPLGLMMQKPGADGYFFEPTSALGGNFQICCRAWSALMLYRLTNDRRAWRYAADQLDFALGKNPYGLCLMEGKGSFNLPRYHHRYLTIPGHETGAVPGTIPNGFVRDLAGRDRPGIDLSTGGRLYPSYRTNEPWLVHNVFYMLAITALHEL